MDFSEKARALVQEQILDWDLVGRNYEGLKNVKVKTFDFGDFNIDVQYNPERIVSSVAKVDEQSIHERSCFLCKNNLPKLQRWIPYGIDYIILVNPFPIFPEHLTIANINHVDQRILQNFETMLDLAAHLSKFVIYYNGPKCGASAPDHLHFQAGIKGFIPVENDLSSEICCREVRTIDGVKVSHWPEYQRGIITLTCNNKANLIAVFNKIYNQLEIARHDDPEPMLNIIAAFDRKTWTIHIFPRTEHRPRQFYNTGDSQILLSPASVDMGGLLVTPREEDFLKITEEDVIDIFEQVCFDTQSVLTLINKL
ncbi:MAG: DUF4922 domain-containing protein [Mariniphaga sp.]